MPIIEKIADYFDLRKREDVAKIQADPNASPIPQYIALVIGIVAQPFLEYYLQKHGVTGNLKSLLLRSGFGLLIGIAIFPAVYRRAWDPSSPRFVQLCSIFSSGLGWQTLFATATGANAHDPLPAG